MTVGFQSPDAPDAGIIAAIAREPALVQLLVLGFGALFAWLLLSRLRRLSREARARAAVRDYLLGVEQTLSGDNERALERLARVLVEDPENDNARLCYALALAECGRPDEAHKHHVQLLHGRGLRSRRNDVGLARTLLETDRPVEAVEAARRAVTSASGDPTALDALFRAELAAGFPEDAARTGIVLAKLLPHGRDRDRVRSDTARALELATCIRLRAGDASAARKFADVAAREQLGSTIQARLEARLAFAEQGPDAVFKDVARAALPASTPDPGGAGLALSRTSAPSQLEARTLAGLADLAPFRCRACGFGHGVSVARCWACGRSNTCEAREAEMFRELDSPARTSDAIEANRNHVQRLCALVVSGDEAAARELVELGDDAVEEVFARAVERGSGDTRLTDVLQRMGPRILPTLFEVYHRRRDDWIRRLGELFTRGSSVATIGRVVQGFGREALPRFDALLGSEDRDLRKIVLDYYIGLGDSTEFQRVLGEFPPVEVIHRLNEAPSSMLSRMLQDLRPGSLVADVLLVDPGFLRDLDVLDAIAGAAEPEVLLQVLIRRGFHRGTMHAMLDRIDDERLRPSIERLVRSYGTRATTHLVSGFADLDRTERARAFLGDCLAELGSDVVEPLCDCFGTAAGPLDADVVALLARIGPRAVRALRDCYQQGGVVERFAGAFARRHTHRRTMLINTLAAIGGAEASRVLREMRERETDTNLKLRLAQALHRLDERGSDDARSGTGDEHEQVG